VAMAKQHITGALAQAVRAGYDVLNPFWNG
jgi:hypothetical protein